MGASCSFKFESEFVGCGSVDAAGDWESVGRSGFEFEGGLVIGESCCGAYSRGGEEEEVGFEIKR